MDATCAIQDNIHLLRLALELPHPTLVEGTEKLFLHTIYSSVKHISMLYLVPFCVK